MINKVENAIKRLKRKNALGPDSLKAEHLLEDGSKVIACLTSLFNALIELEIILGSLKCGIVLPLYKGSGKDHLKMDIHRVWLSL